MSLLFTYIKQNKWLLKKKTIFLYFDWFSCEVITIFLLPGSGSTFPEMDPDPDKIWSDRILIRNTALKDLKFFLQVTSLRMFHNVIEHTPKLKSWNGLYLIYLLNCISNISDKWKFSVQLWNPQRNNGPVL